MNYGLFDRLRHADATPCAGRRCERLNDADHRFDRPTAFHTDQSMTDGGGTFRTMIVTANEPGYHPGPEIEAEDYAAAERIIEAMNARMGVTPDQARDIVISSMFGVQYGGATQYAIARTLKDVQSKVDAGDGGSSLDIVAATITDLHGTAYEGPTPVPGGAAVRGVIRAYTPGQTTILPPKAVIHVWAAAFTQSKNSARHR